MDKGVTFLANKPKTALCVKEDVDERPKPLALCLEPKHLIVSATAIPERFKKNVEDVGLNRTVPFYITLYASSASADAPGRAIRGIYGLLRRVGRRRGIRLSEHKHEI